jgi:hypothetical protein
LRFLNFPSRFQVYGLKMIPLGLAWNVSPVVVELKPGVTPCQPETVLHSSQGPGQNSKTFKIWAPPTLSFILGHPLITSPETGYWGFQASSRTLGSKFSKCHFAPHSPKSICTLRPCPSWGKDFCLPR